MTTQSPKLKKTHNWTTNGKVVDPHTNRTAMDFICGCNHLTPAKEAELDAMFAEMERNAPDPIKSVCMPDPEVLKAYDTEEPDWMDSEPPPEAFEFEPRAVR